MDFSEIELTRILVVCTKASQQIRKYSERVYEIDYQPTPAEAFERLYRNTYDIIVMEIALFGDEAARAINEMRRRFPFTSILVIEDEHHSNLDLLNMGADGIISANPLVDEWHYVVHSQLKQQRQKVALNNRNRKLDLVARLSYQLHFAENTRALVKLVITKLCSALNLYGVVIVLDEDENLHLYAGNDQTPQFYETMPHFETYHPFQRTINTGICQVYGDIKVDPHYQAIPLLNNATSAIIVPLRYKTTSLGILGVFSYEDQRFTPDELIIYEIFASHFTTALTQVRLQRMQQEDFAVTQHLLAAWHRFANIYKIEELADMLLFTLQKVTGVANLLVWLYDGSGKTAATVAKSTEIHAVEIFHELDEDNVVSNLLKEVDEKNQIVLRKHREPGKYIAPLLDRMGRSEYLLFGIVNANTVAGGVILASMPNSSFRMNQVNLTEGILEIVAQKYEHIILLSETNNKSTHLEALLRNVGEGILFVDAANQVSFCNTQFTEVTGINRSQILHQHYHVMIELLIAQTDNPIHASNALLKAINQIEYPNQQEDYYSIIELSINNQVSQWEFSALTSVEGSIGWSCSIRIRQTLSVANMQENPLHGLVFQHSYPLIGRIYHNLQQLLKVRNNGNPRQWMDGLREMNQEVMLIEQIWFSFFQLHSAPSADDQKELEFAKILEELIATEGLPRSKMQALMVDGVPRFTFLSIAGAKVVHYLLMYVILKTDMKIPLQFSSAVQDNRLILVFENFQPTVSPMILRLVMQENLERVTDFVMNDAGLFGLYLSCNLLRQENGEAHFEEQSNGQYRFVITIDGVPQEQSVGQSAKLQAPEQTLRTVMMIEQTGNQIMRDIRQELEKHGTKFISYKHFNQVIEDVQMIRVDLIIVEANSSEFEIHTFVERLRRQTQAPIILCSEKASHIERVRGLRAGAEDYLTQELSLEEVLTRVNIIFKRQTMSERMREVLELKHLKIDFTRRQVILKGKPIVITRTEYNLLRVLATNMGNLLTHQELLREVWGPEYQSEKQYLWVNLSRLRKKLEPDPDGPHYIHNEAGMGYVFTEVLPDGKELKPSTRHRRDEPSEN